MGQSQSGEARHASMVELSHELALKFTQRCFTPIELYSFQDVFKSLADHQDSIAYLKEDTIARFLELPDSLGVSSIIFQMLSYLGAFPFGQEAPVVLGFEQMVMVVVIMTQRYQKVLRKGNRDWNKLLFRSLAVYDRHRESDAVEGPSSLSEKSSPTNDSKRSHAAGFTIDEPIRDDRDDEDEDEDDLAWAALESLDAIGTFNHGDGPLTQAAIPTDNLKGLLMLLLLLAPLRTQESLAQHAERLNRNTLENLGRTADCILAAFVNVEKYAVVKCHHFNTVIPISLPFLFNGFNPLFERFLFSKNIDFTKRETPNVSTSPPTDAITTQPLLPREGEILDLNVLSQLSFFIPGSSLFRQLRLLYSGGDAGFSMGSFETKVLNWRAPTILLVSGNRLAETPAAGPEQAFADKLPPKRYPDSSTASHLVFGIYLSQPWRQTHKECIGNTDTLLFQLEPTHEVFHASSMNTDYVSFIKPPSSHPGIGIGNPHPKAKATAGLSTHVGLGTVSLTLDSSFEFGVFTHDYTSSGGAFYCSQTRKRDWQDRFEIESLEVWGCGGDAEAEEKRKRWAWEEREAEARRKVNLGTGDIETDRALLEMAGLIVNNRSGGSMS